MRHFGTKHGERGERSDALAFHVGMSVNERDPIIRWENAQGDVNTVSSVCVLRPASADAVTAIARSRDGMLQEER